MTLERLLQRCFRAGKRASMCEKCLFWAGKIQEQSNGNKLVRADKIAALYVTVSSSACVSTVT